MRYFTMIQAEPVACEDHDLVVCSDVQEEDVKGYKESEVGGDATAETSGDDFKPLPVIHFTLTGEVM